MFSAQLFSYRMTVKITTRTCRRRIYISTHVVWNCGRRLCASVRLSFVNLDVTRSLGDNIVNFVLFPNFFAEQNVCNSPNKLAFLFHSQQQYQRNGKDLGKVMTFHSKWNIFVQVKRPKEACIRFCHVLVTKWTWSVSTFLNWYGSAYSAWEEKIVYIKISSRQE